MNQSTLADSLVAAALAAKENRPLLAGVAAIYRAADAAVASRRPLCHQSGRCCQFEKMGHNLFVTTAELAYFLHATVQPCPEVVISGVCPFLRTNPSRCTARRGRLLGCRIFHCDPTAQWWQQILYNQLHARLQRLHVLHDLHYAYGEWLTILQALRRQQS